MPILFHEPILPPGEWGLWHITESEAVLRQRIHLHAQEKQQLDRIRGAARRREFLAARLLLHTMSGRKERAELVKDDDGKPHLEDSLFYVSISHTVGYSAAIAHPRTCGIDVQRIVPRIRMLAPRFVGPEENARLDDRYALVQLHLLWAAKEALYKAYGRRQLDFRAQLVVDLSDYTPGSGSAHGSIRLEQRVLSFHLEYREYPGYVLMAAVETT